MIENSPTNVFTAFEILLEEIEAEIDAINEVGAKAFKERDYESVRETGEHASQIIMFREKIVALREEWDVLEGVRIQRADTEEEAVHIERRFLGRLQRGSRTSQGVYYQPILDVLKELGGSAKTSDVLDRLEQTMKSVLRQVDYEPLPSDSEIRWRKTAQWARLTMVKKGLLKSDSPWGIWEITEAGRMARTKGAS